MATRNIPGATSAQSRPIPESIVVHRATADLDKLYNELDQWHANTVCRPKAPADSADAQPSGSQP